MVIGHRVFWVAIALIMQASFCGLRESHAEPIPSNELIEKAKSFDGKTVIYRGEAVSAVLKRGDHAWVNLNDGINAIGVWCDAPQVVPIKFVGDYKNRGDIVEVVGIFHRACSVHGGELDIHADVVKVVESGFRVEERTDGVRASFATVLFLITLSIVVIFRRRI